MRRTAPEFQFEDDTPNSRVRFEVGQTVPISMRYCLGQRPVLVAIEGDLAVLQFPNGARLAQVPLRDLVDDSGYWKR